MACNVACGTAGKACNAACVTPPTRSDDDVRCAAYASELGVNEQKRLRVLCLHSFRTNAKILETQLMLRGWLKRLGIVSNLSISTRPTPVQQPKH